VLVQTAVTLAVIFGASRLFFAQLEWAGLRDAVLRA
jgi:hypothetical protein